MPSDTTGPSLGDEPALRRQLGADTLGRARSLLTMALEPPDDERPLEPGARLGDYVLVRPIGRGGMGVVYQARGLDGDVVALKVMLPSSDAETDDADVRRFRAGAEAARDLDHPNIVRVLAVGEDDGRHFLTMPFVDGGNLAQAIAAAPPSPRRAASWLAKVARAVHHAHQHGVLHRDLTPANIVLDRDGQPHVTDFGLARRMDRQVGSLTSAGAGTGAGNPRYMAPEQAATNPKNLTVAADIYALGAILFELLTGTVPIDCEGLVDLLRQLDSPEPVRRPRSLVADLDLDLESICRKCLEKEPRLRYPSAELLAQDLEHWLAGVPIAPRRSVWSRAFAWVSRHPWRTIGVAGIVALLFVALGIRQQAERDEWATNASFASAQAGTMLYQLREYADRLAQAAADPAIVVMLEAPRAVKGPPTLLEAYSRKLDVDLFLMGKNGYLWAQSPLPPDGGLFERSFAFRDYFRGAEVLAAAGHGGAYLARTVRSESDGRFKFGFSAPVFDHREWVGVLVALKDVSSVFGEVQLVDPASDGRRITALLGPRDRDRKDGPDAPLPAGLMFVVHPALARAEEHALGPLAPALSAGFGASAPPGAQFNLRYVPPHKVHDYQDPPPGLGGGRLAAFAPVGETGYVVLVQTGASASPSATTSGSAKTPKSGS